jgi:phage shock protein PspC (stress-responsive transcriptional regulator)
MLDGHTPSEEGSGTSSFPRASGARAWFGPATAASWPECVAGVGRRFGLEPWPARLLFVLVLLVLPGSQLLVYPVLWILMPNEETDSTAEVTTPIATTI